MLNFINSYAYLRKYNKFVYPNLQKKTSEYLEYSHRIRKPSTKNWAAEALNRAAFDAAVSTACLLYPGVDSAPAADILFSFTAILQYLNMICVNSIPGNSAFLKIIFSSLKDAVNLRSDSFYNYFTFFPSKDDDGYLQLLVEKCRQKVLQLPSFDIVRDEFSAALTLYIDLQVIKYSSFDNEAEDNLERWSEVHGQKYPGLSVSEFCMSVDSPLNMKLLLALATDPDLEEEAVNSLSGVFFPWINGIHKILESYLYYNNNLFSLGPKYKFYYDNLKEYERRIIYFIQEAMRHSEASRKFPKTVIKILLAIHISHPNANTGMNQITRSAILRAGGRGMRLYSSAVKHLEGKLFIS